MKNPPTQSQLAALAASLPTGDARERVSLADAIWKEAGNLIEDREIVGRLGSMAGSVPEWLSLDDLLKKAIPSQSATRADRIKSWRDFLTARMDSSLAPVSTPGGQPVLIEDEDHARGLAEEWLGYQRENGVAGAPEMMGEFKEWLTEKAAETRTARAKSGAAAKNGKKPLGEEKSERKRD